MKIGLLSDTHGYLDERIFHHFEKCDELWHAGDIGNMHVLEQLAAFRPLQAVYGNIDGQEIRRETPEDLEMERGGMVVRMTHIGGYPPKYNKRTRAMLKNRKTDLFVCGHSHILRIMHDSVHKLLHINPGAAGMQGFHKVRTLVRFDIEDKEVKNMQVIELGSKTNSTIS